MKIKHVSPSIKIFFISLIALSMGGWKFGFYLGAYDTIFSTTYLVYGLSL